MNVLSALWYLIVHYPFQTIGSMTVMAMCLVELAYWQSKKGDRDDEN